MDLYGGAVSMHGFYGKRVTVAMPHPRIMLREEVPCSDAFRKEFNAFLLEEFGGGYVIPKGCVYEFQDGSIIVRADDYAELRKATDKGAGRL